MNGIMWICQNKTLGSENMIGIYLSGTGNTKHCIEKLVGLIDNSAKVFPLEMPNLILKLFGIFKLFSKSISDLKAFYYSLNK